MQYIQRHLSRAFLQGTVQQTAVLLHFRMSTAIKQNRRKRRSVGAGDCSLFSGKSGGLGAVVSRANILFMNLQLRKEITLLLY